MDGSGAHFAIELAMRTGFIVELLAILVVGKMLRDVSLLARGYETGELLAVQDNHAAAIDLAGYIFALVTAVLGSLVIRESGWLAQASDIAMAGLVVIVCLAVNDVITDKLLFRGIDDHAAIINDRNIAVAIGRAGSAIATGLVIRGALGNGDAMVDCLIWVPVGQVALVVVAWLYQRLTPYDDIAELKDGNVAAALPIAGVLIAVGIIVEAAIHGETHHFWTDLASMGMFLAVAVVLLYLLRLCVEWFLLNRANLADEITRDRNIGAGLLEGVAFILGATVLSFFLT